LRKRCREAGPERRKPADALAKCGLAAVAERFGVTLGECERGRSVDFPQGLFGTRFDIAQACLEADGIVSQPKGNGPRGGTPVAMTCLLLSADPVALDATFCRMVDLDPGFVPTVTYGRKSGLGNYAEDWVEIAGEAVDQFRKPGFDVVRAPVINTTGKMEVPHFIGTAIFPRPEIDPDICVRCGSLSWEGCSPAASGGSARTGPDRGPLKPEAYVQMGLEHEIIGPILFPLLE
jgi:hypothetical protein